MGKSKPPGDRSRSHFMFSYREHRWFGDTEIDSKESFEQAMSQQASFQTWEEVKPGPRANLNAYTCEEFASVEAFQTQAEEELPGESRLLKTIFQSPFDKLKAMMNAEGWKFVTGWTHTFEGNHNDTEIHVVLEKKDHAAKPAKKPAAKKSPAKKAATKKPKAAEKKK